MDIKVDASYEHNSEGDSVKFAVISLCFENGNKKAYFMPPMFRLNGMVFEVNQIVAEFYAVYLAALLAPADGNTIIYTDNISVYEMISGIGSPKNKQMELLYVYIMPILELKNIKVDSIGRANNREANYLSLRLLRQIRDMIKEDMNLPQIAVL